MNANEDRFWEAAIAEAVTGREPPDQAALILARLNAHNGLPARPWRRVGMHVLQTAAAATVLLALGIATGLVRRPDDPPPAPVQPRVYRELIAAPGAQWRDGEGRVVLESGALLLSTGAPLVSRGDSTLTDVKGLALVYAGVAPEGATEQALMDWLQTKDLEEVMLKHATRWIQGAALAVLMLQGTATLDGQPVEAEKPTEPVWHRVQTVMELDLLPPEAKYVEASGLPGDYLPIFAKTERLEGVAFLRGTSLTQQHIEAVAAMPHLRILDLRRGNWTSGMPDYTPLLKLTKLRRIGLDLFVTPPRKDADPEEAKAAEKAAVDSQLETFKQFKGRGVTPMLGVNTYGTRQLGALRDALPDTADLHLYTADDDACAGIAGFEHLRKLRIDYCSATELGYVKLSGLARLERLELTFASGVQPSFVHHLAKVKTLMSLELSFNSPHVNVHTLVPSGVVTTLGTMKQLKELHLQFPFWQRVATADGQPSSPLLALDNLEVFSMHVSGDPNQGEQIAKHVYRHPLDVGLLVNARHVKLSLASERRLAYGRQDEALHALHSTAGSRIETLTLRLLQLSPRVSDEEKNWVAALSRYPSLKRFEVGRMPGGAPGNWTGGQLVAILKESLPQLEVVELPAP